MNAILLLAAHLVSLPPDEAELARARIAIAQAQAEAEVHRKHQQAPETLTPPQPEVLEKLGRPAGAPVELKPRTQTVPLNWHSHLCRNCGTEFWHGPENKGIEQSHHCPKCGAGPWYNVNRYASSLPHGAIRCDLIPTQADPPVTVGQQILQSNPVGFSNYCPPGRT